MGLYDVKPCPCGSGKDSRWLSDAKGIPVNRVCSECEQTTRKKYRPEVFTEPDYWTDEAVDEDY